ncbi:WD40-repeat-containing domain protein [Coemansia spiralis]|nr:WD40-repeat-containing domain protein [Coemansia spiralis]
MKVKTVLVNWHDKLPIFSVDFDHSYTDSRGGWRFATGGGDNNVRIWRLRTQKEREADPHQPMVEFLASLNRHTAPVNVVRFAPCSSKLASAGDDGVIIIWRQTEGGDQPPANLDDQFAEPETWRPLALLRGSLADICDLAWSPDGRFLVSASVDNTARIWDASEARCVQVLADHSHYLQGVAWDPLGEFIATQSSDRSLRVYKWHSDANMDTEDSAPVQRTQRLFHDDNLASFFRRPSISPDGRLLATAAGVQRDRAARNVCYVWARDGLAGPPALSLAGHQKPVVATRWAPCEFSAIGLDANNGEWLAPTAGADKGSPRMMLAVGSQGAVALYDTSVAGRAVGLVGGLHYAAITDLAWTADGSHLVITSIDGFASVASLDQPSAALEMRRRTADCEEDAIMRTQDNINSNSNSGNSSTEAAVPTPAQASVPGARGKKRLAPTFVSTL